MAGGMEINPVANFNVNGDKLSQSWVRWHRSFELYATGKAITDKKTEESFAFALCRTRCPRYFLHIRGGRR